MEENKLSDVLSDKEMKRLAQLGKGIRLGLECDINGHGVPCRTDRLDVVEKMKEYLEIHDYTITQKNNMENTRIE